MKVEVVTPEDYTGSVIGDLNSRRGQIQGQDMRGNAVVINAMVPLANMFGYVNTLRSMTQGRATYTMQFDHYEQVPRGEAAEVQSPSTPEPQYAKSLERSTGRIQRWPKRSLRGRSRTATLGRSAMSTTARRR